MRTIRASIRELFYKLFPTASHFEGFLCDYFSEEYKQISAAKVSYQERITMLLERKSEQEILDALNSALDDKKESWLERDYLYAKKCVEQLMNGEPIDHLQALGGGKTRIKVKTSSRYRRLKKLATWMGLLYIWETFKTIWKQLGLTIRSDGNGKIIIVSTAGGCLVISTGIWSCYYRDKPLFEGRSGAHLESTAPVRFCFRDLSVKMTPAADMELDKAALSSTIARLIAQSDLGRYYASYYQNHHQVNSRASILNSYPANGVSPAPISLFNMLSDCALISDDRLRIDIKLNIRIDIDRTIKTCYPDGKCQDSYVRSEACDFSFLIQDDLNEYECPMKEFSLSSSGMNYLEMETQSAQMDRHLRALRAIENCKGVVSSIGLLSACHRRKSQPTTP